MAMEMELMDFMEFIEKFLKELKDKKPKLIIVDKILKKSLEN